MAVAGHEPSRRFAFRPDLELLITAQRRAVLGHFEAEYAPALAAESARAPEAAATFVSRLDGGSGGGYKTARWSVALSDPASETLALSIAVSGRPISFALSLVQGYFVEPVVSVASARRGYVLLPAAGVRADGGALLLLGRSRAGKSSLAARALVAGKRVLGDDQVLLDAAGRCWRFPRRLRLYSDLPRTAPRAYARLGAGARAALRTRALLRRASGGWIAAPVRIALHELGPPATAEPLDVAGVVLIERRAGGREVQVEDVDPTAAAAHALELLERQRVRLSSVSAVWARALDAIREQEASTLERALAGRSVRAVSVPDEWDAARAITALASVLELD